MSVTTGANSPNLKFEMDVTNAPSNPSRAYSDLSSDVRELTFSTSGRNNELQRSSPGQLQVTLDNRAGKYDTTNTASAYYPKFARTIWCRVTATWAGVDYIRWTGLVETIKQSWPGNGVDAIVTVTAVDVFKILSLYDLYGKSYPSQTSSARVAAVCADAGLPSTVDASPAATLPAIGPFSVNSYALQHLLDVEGDENGLLIAAMDGSVTFQGRHYRVLNSQTASATIGDNYGAEIPYRDGELDDDDGDIWNTVVVTPAGGSPVTATNATSIANHFPRTLSRSLLQTSSVEATACAQYLAAKYAEPGPRIPRVSLVGRADTTKWPVILGVAHSKRYTWKRRAAMHTITSDVFVERMSERVMPGEGWQVQPELSPATSEFGWLLGNSVYGLLGSTTQLIY